MGILIIAEHDNSQLKPSTLNTLSAAQAIGGDIDILVAGNGCDGVAEQASKLGGVRKVLLASNAAYEHQLAENVAPLVADLGVDYGHVETYCSRARTKMRLRKKV